MSMAWQYWRRTPPRAWMPAGQETISGSAVPPRRFPYRFHILNGVLNAHAHPVG